MGWTMLVEVTTRSLEDFGQRCGSEAGFVAALLLFFFFSACLFSALARMSVLLLVCLFQASVMWRFIHFQLRRWREYWHEQSSRKRAAAATAGAKQQAKPLKRDSGEHRRAPGGGTVWSCVLGTCLSC